MWYIPWIVISFHYIMEENCDFMDAGNKAFVILREDPWMLWVLGLVSDIISSIGILACIVGIFVSYPVKIVMFAEYLERRFPKT